MDQLSGEQAVDELITILDFLRWGISVFTEAKCYYGHGTARAEEDAASLICHVTHLDFEQLHHFYHARLCRAEREQLVDLFLKRASDKMPVSYLAKTAWFAGLEFYVDKRALIPRSPLAELIETGYSPWINREKTEQVLDLCTGSGCIAVATAYYCDNVHVDAIDIDSEALQVAKKNVARYGLEGRITLIQSDLYEALAGRLYDLIVTNPPYVPIKSMRSLPAEYSHEPKIALEAGSDGLYYVCKIIARAPEYLKSSGILIVEVGEAADNLVKYFPDVPFIWLEFERGGEGVFILEYHAIIQYQKDFIRHLRTYKSQ